MNKILLLTTKGCEACKTQEHLLKEGIRIYGKSIELDIRDVKDLPTHYLRHYDVKDFPTTMLLKGDECLFKYSGTRPAIVNARFMEVNF